MRPLYLLRESFPDDPALDTALSRAVLERVAAGERPATLRIARPGPMVAFGKQDAVARGYPAAVAAARAAGFHAVLRLAGGRAAVFHEDTIELALAIPDPEPRAGIHHRFEEASQLVAAALRGLGIDARVGEVQGEYCPGGYSINARGRVKLVGLGQRLIRGAAHIGGVVVVAGEARVRDALVPVYRELGLDWEPSTAGSVAGELGSASFEQVAAAVEAEYAGRYEIVEDRLDAGTLALARRFVPEHRSPSLSVHSAGG